MKWLVALLVLALAACTRETAEAPPAQVASGAALRHAMWSADPLAEARIVRDIGPLEGLRFRWTGKSPEVKLELPVTEGLHFHAHFWLSDQAMRQTGPVTIRYFANDRELRVARYDAPGEQIIDIPVESAMLKAGDNRLRMEIDKLYELDGVGRGVALTEFGFGD